MKACRIQAFQFHVVGHGRNAYLRIASPPTAMPNDGYVGSIDNTKRIRRLRDYLTLCLRTGRALEGGAK